MRRGFREIRVREVKEDTTVELQRYMETEEFKRKKAESDAIFASVFSQSWGDRIDQERTEMNKTAEI